MRTKKVMLVLAAIIALIVFGAGYWLGFTVAQGGGQLLCTANPCRITMTRNGVDGLVIKDAAGPKLEDSLLIIDPHGLPELWQTASGAYEGPKGSICTTDNRYAALVCLTSNGRTGLVRIDGQQLTAADIAWLHRAERSPAGRALVRAGP
jgi:hypothetical protein